MAMMLACSIATFAQENPEQNSPPVISFSSPVKYSKFQWNTTVPYSITVIDKEDGNSEYNEILSSEVLLVITYLKDSSHTGKYLLEVFKMNIEPFRLMSTSGCFTCHTAKGKLIGPSFEDIAKRSLNNSIKVESIVEKIMHGSTGTWGDLKMPPHSDLKTAQVMEIVNWILKKNIDPNVNFLVGTDGAFRTKEKIEGDDEKGAYVLTASYLDHGLKGIEKSKKQSQHSVILKN
jgi:cytochrome c